MVWSFLFLLVLTIGVESYAVRDVFERLAHGRQLKIFLPKSAERLEFIPANDPGKTFLYWQRSGTRISKGRVSGTGTDRRWYLDKATFEDEGTYTQRDFWDHEISTLKVAIITRHNYVKRIPGESLSVSLEGIELADATLLFSGDVANVTLVKHGSPVSQDIPEYWDRVKPRVQSIDIQNVNTSDVGRYTLIDQRNRVVSVTRMDLTDHHEMVDGNPLLALLLLLGIPVGICCCCRKKIFKKSAASTTTTFQATPETVHVPPGPAGPPPAYGGVSPGPAGPVFYNNTGPGPDPSMGYQGPATGPMVHPPPSPMMPGQHPAGFTPGYNPQNPGYPPSMAPQDPGYNPQNPLYPPSVNPAQPPQWSGPPPGQYNPGAPMGYAPVMYSAPPPSGEPEKEQVKMENGSGSPADPLLVQSPQGSASTAPSVPPNAPTDALHSPGNAYQFQVDAGKNSSTNFL